MAQVNEDKIDAVLALVRAELLRATERFPVMASPHEGYAILLEEVDELWDEVKANRHDSALAECVQVAAMAARFLVDLGVISDAGRIRTPLGSGPRGLSYEQLAKFDCQGEKEEIYSGFSPSPIRTEVYDPFFGDEADDNQ